MAKLKVHYEKKAYFWGTDLTKAREALGLSQEEFAIECGWTQPNQYKLELPGIRHRLTEKHKEAFNQLNIQITS